jgi:hypothetical protein
VNELWRGKQILADGKDQIDSGRSIRVVKNQRNLVRPLINDGIRKRLIEKLKTSPLHDEMTEDGQDLSWGEMMCLTFKSPCICRILTLGCM